MNSKHPAASVLVLANLSKLPVFVFQHWAIYFHICNVALQTSNTNINLDSVDVSAVLMLLVREMSVSTGPSVILGIHYI